MPKQRYRKSTLCKPCWELKYCPYGVIVETMPFLNEGETTGKHATGETWDEMYARAIITLKNSDFSDENDVWHNMFFGLLCLNTATLDSIALGRS